MHDLLQGTAKPSERNVFIGTPGLPLGFRGRGHFAKSFVFCLPRGGGVYGLRGWRTLRVSDCLVCISLSPY